MIWVNYRVRKFCVKRGDIWGFSFPEMITKLWYGIPQDTPDPGREGKALSALSLEETPQIFLDSVTSLLRMVLFLGSAGWYTG